MHHCCSCNLPLPQRHQQQHLLQDVSRFSQPRQNSSEIFATRLCKFQLQSHHNVHLPLQLIVNCCNDGGVLVVAPPAIGSCLLLMRLPFQMLFVGVGDHRLHQDLTAAAALDSVESSWDLGYRVLCQDLPHITGQEEEGRPPSWSGGPPPFRRVEMPASN